MSAHYQSVMWFILPAVKSLDCLRSAASLQTHCPSGSKAQGHWIGKHNPFMHATQATTRGIQR
eukprot:scaffold283582_cov15-Tisochrysis_lutea.AAC.1